MTRSGPLDIGVDLGGTGTRLVALRADGSVFAQVSTRTDACAAPEQAVDHLIDTVTDLAAGLPIRSLGIGASGPVDADGVIRNPATLPAYSGVPITDLISGRLAVPCAIDNDAVTAALGELHHGAGLGSSALLVITLGTGIGVAMLRAGVAYRAADGSHPEAGHLAVTGPPAPCYCGLYTCWEQLASRTALERLVAGDLAAAAVRARHGDPAQRALFDDYGHRIGFGLGSLLTLFRPDTVVLGGGGARYLDLFADAVQHSVRRAPEFASPLVLKAAALGDQSGAIGAAVLGRAAALHQRSLAVPG